MRLSLTIINLYAIYTAFALRPENIDTFKKKPEKCYGTYELTDRRCCIFPPFFDEASARQCGARIALMYLDNKYNVTNMRREIPGNCKYWRCILKLHKMLNNEDKLIHGKYSNHLDNWASLNYEFSNVLTSAKVFCRNLYRFQMPVSVCEFYNFQSCIRNYINVDCPKVIQSKECFEWKEFYEECREFFI